MTHVTWRNKNVHVRVRTQKTKCLRRMYVDLRQDSSHKLEHSLLPHIVFQVSNVASNTSVDASCLVQWTEDPGGPVRATGLLPWQFCSFGILEHRQMVLRGHRLSSWWFRLSGLQVDACRLAYLGFRYVHVYPRGLCGFTVVETIWLEKLKYLGLSLAELKH